MTQWLAELFEDKEVLGSILQNVPPNIKNVTKDKIEQKWTYKLKNKIIYIRGKFSLIVYRDGTSLDLSSVERAGPGLETGFYFF